MSQQLGKYKVPGELKDEDKWFRFFTKNQLVAALVVLIVDWRLIVFTSKLHIVIIGFIIAILLTIVSALVILCKMPSNKHLYGGGFGLHILLLRVLNRKLRKKNKVVYTIAMEYEED